MNVVRVCEMTLFIVGLDQRNEFLGDLLDHAMSIETRDEFHRCAGHCDPSRRCAVDVFRRFRMI